MAISATNVDSNVFGSRRVTVTDVTFDSSYPTGGEPITAAELGLSTVLHATCNVKAVGGTINVANAFYDQANGKIKVYDETPAEVANASTLATLVVRVMAYGY